MSNETKAAHSRPNIPPRRMTRKQSQKWARSSHVPKWLRHAGHRPAYVHEYVEVFA